MEGTHQLRLTHACIRAPMSHQPPRSRVARLNSKQLADEIDPIPQTVDKSPTISSRILPKFRPFPCTARTKTPPAPHGHAIYPRETALNKEQTPIISEANHLYFFKEKTGLCPIQGGVMAGICRVQTSGYIVYRQFVQGKKNVYRQPGGNTHW